MRLLKEIRDEIDALDEKIVEAISARAALSEAERLALVEAGLPSRDEMREKRVVSRIIELSPLPERDVIYSVYERILGGAAGLIETVSRAVIVKNGKVLLCRSKGGDKYYLPGGHIEFGEKASVALKREILEETALDSNVGDLLGVVENSFLQHGKKHCEINLVYQAEIEDGEVKAVEDWIEFDWVEISSIDSVELLPIEMKKFIKVSI